MHADGKSTLALVSKWNSGKVNSVSVKEQNFGKGGSQISDFHTECYMMGQIYNIV